MTSNVIGRLKNLLVLFARCRHCRGFGVQSPWAYSFIRYVIGERWPYYAYERLDKAFGKQGWIERRVNRLYFRISNYVRSDVVLDFSSSDDLSETYIKEGCRCSRVVKVPVDIVNADYSHFLADVGHSDFVLISLEGYWREFFVESRRHAGDRTLFVVRDINRDGYARQCWRSIVDDNENIVTFDLYYCGIVFFDRKRYKQNYIVNF